MAERCYSFLRSHRIRSRGEFGAVFESGIKQSKGPLAVFASPNELGYSRLGLSLSRRVGTAVKRNRIKRLLRESFRLMQHDLPRGYDLVIVVRPHEPLRLAEYQRLLARMLFKLHRESGNDE